MSLLPKIIAMFGGVVAVEYLVAGGGGPGGSAVSGSTGQAGHGGAGGFKQGTMYLSLGASVPVTVGAKGVAGGADATGSAFGTIAVGGGGRGGDTLNDGGNGASGGGGGNGASTSGGLGVPGEGHNGAGGSGSFRGGGGGAGGPGGGGGTPGPGVVSSISGAAVTYCAGGGVNGPGCGGQGGFGTTGGEAIPAFDGTVIARYWGPQRATGGTVTSSGGYTIHTFTSAGTFTL